MKQHENNAAALNLIKANRASFMAALKPQLSI